MLALAATRPDVVGELFLITDGEATTRMRILEIICEEMGYPLPTRHSPTWFVKLALPAIEAFYTLKRGKTPPLVNKFKLKFMTTPLTYRIDKARRLLGYAPKMTTEQGLRATAKWFRENHPELGPA